MDLPFLKGGPISFSHSVSLNLSDEDIELLKFYVYKIPNYKPDTYRWPIQANAAKFTCKENVNQPFTDIWEIDNERLIGMKTFDRRPHMGADMALESSDLRLIASRVESSRVFRVRVWI